MGNSSDKDNKLDLHSLRQCLPESPGVYLFKDRSGRVIYVGKAKELKKRILSYFRPPDLLPVKTRVMMKKAKDLAYIITATENEAFILEGNLIKRHMPRYNIILRDDKNYPCLRLSISDNYPRLSIVRKVRKDGAIYFGPFSSSSSVRSTLNLIDTIFRLRKCKGSPPAKRSRPCLNYQLGRCLAPCTRDIQAKDYKVMVEQVRLFLEGNSLELLNRLKKEMKESSVRLDFEEAARIRDMIRAVEKTTEPQDVVSFKMEDQDVIGLAQGNDIFQLVILFVRKGVLLGRRNFSFKYRDASASEIMTAFLKQYYSKEIFIPKQILISVPVDEVRAIGGYLSDLSGKRVAVHCPRRGDKLRIIKMALSNAEDLFVRNRGIGEEDLMGLSRSVLKLEKEPRLMEGLDISAFYGRQAVGSIVSFVDGQPHRPGYRNFKIKTVDGIDDYSMMAELISRRLSRGSLPDLFIVDGGKGHLKVVKKVLDDFEGKGSDLPGIVAIAKGDDIEQGGTDKVYVPGRKNPLSLKREHPVLLLLIRIRDEAHRRAVSYHRNLRARNMKESLLDQIPGVGEKRKRLLLGRFGDINGIWGAKKEDLMLIPGINQALAQEILRFLYEKRNAGSFLESSK
jgi:excinuclease ABC subunit C